jgi:hypothetical protein
MTVQELIEYLKNYPRDAKIDVNITSYTLYPSNDDSTDVMSLTTRYDKLSNTLDLLFKK